MSEVPLYIGLPVTYREHIPTRTTPHQTLGIHPRVQFTPVILHGVVFPCRITGVTLHTGLYPQKDVTSY